MILKRFLLALCLFNSHSFGLAATDASDATDELYLRLESLQRQGNVVSPTLVKAIIEHKRRTGPNAFVQSSLLSEQAGVDGIELGRWLDKLESNPASLGRSTFRNEPLVVANQVNLSQIYTLGMPLNAGSEIVTSRFWRDGQPLQNQIQQRDNFVRARVGKGAETRYLTPSQTQLKGNYGGLSRGLPTPSFLIDEQGLKAGDQITFEYDNLYMPYRATQHFVLPILIRPFGHTYFVQTSDAKLVVAAGPAVDVAFDVPAYIESGASFDAQLRPLDQFGNLASGRTPSFDILIDGSFVQRVDAGVGQKHFIDDLRLPQTDIPPTIEVRSSGGGIKSQASAFVIKDTGDSLYWADVNAIHYPGLAAKGDGESESVGIEITGLSLDETTSENWDAIQNPKGWVDKRTLMSGGQQLVISPQYPNLVAGIPTNTLRRDDKQAFAVALAEVPLDDRISNNVQLVEILTGNGGFEWYGHRLLDRGFRLGFTASDNAITVPVGLANKRAKTAIIVQPNETPIDALRRGRTFITSGDKIVLDVSVNGAAPGSRAPPSLQRVIKGQVSGTAPLMQVELFKNGKVIDQHNFAKRNTTVVEDTEGAVAFESAPQSRRLKVSFTSSSAPAMGQRDLPRNGREWIGYVKSEMADIGGLAAPSFTRPAIQAVLKNPKIANRVDFITWTRGETSSFLLQLDNVTDDAIIELNLREGQEDNDVVTRLRQPATFASARYMISLLDLEQGPITRTMLVDGYQDIVTFEWLDQAYPTHLSFQFIDRALGNTQDYYYIRVKQINDQAAWSSPVFVGGFDHP
ncbi:MAG: hypothetical protein P8R02_05915 [Pseudomonadales bacterium]|nr:hypothetical protein [Pseudomonadales bacterium]